jgi:hypothetical protein
VSQPGPHVRSVQGDPPVARPVLAPDRWPWRCWCCCCCSSRRWRERLTSGLTGGLESSSAEVVRLRPAGPHATRRPACCGGGAETGDRSGRGAWPPTSPIGLSVFTRHVWSDRRPRATGPADAQCGGAQSGGAELDVQLVGGDPSGPSVPAEVAEGRLPTALGRGPCSAGRRSTTPIDIGRTGCTVEGVTTFTVVGSADDAAFNVLPTLYVPFEDYVVASQERAGAAVDVPPSLIGVTVADGARSRRGSPRALNESVDGIEALDRADAVAALPGVGQITQSFSILYLLLYIVVASGDGRVLPDPHRAKGGRPGAAAGRRGQQPRRDRLGADPGVGGGRLGCADRIGGHRRPAGPHPGRVRRGLQLSTAASPSA